LKKAGLAVVAHQRSPARATAQNLHYLATKRERAGHLIELDPAAREDQAAR
jgi:GTP cyclohydrolase II